MYHFVLDFTLKLVGTEVGIIEPITSFSSCFGSAFMLHKMNVHAGLLIRDGGLCGFAFAFAQENIPSVPRDVIRTLQQGGLATCRVAEWAFIRAESSATRTWPQTAKADNLELGLGFCVDGGSRLPWRFARSLVLVGLSNGPVLIRRLPVGGRTHGL